MAVTAVDGVKSAFAPVRRALGLVFEPILSHKYRMTWFLFLVALSLLVGGAVFQLFDMVIMAGIFGALAVSFIVQGVLAAPVIWFFHHLGRGQQTERTETSETKRGASEL